MVTELLWDLFIFNSEITVIYAHTHGFSNFSIWSCFLYNVREGSTFVGHWRVNSRKTNSIFVWPKWSDGRPPCFWFAG